LRPGEGLREGGVNGVVALDDVEGDIEGGKGGDEGGRRQKAVGRRRESLCDCILLTAYCLLVEGGGFDEDGGGVEAFAELALEGGEPFVIEGGSDENEGVLAGEVAVFGDEELAERGGAFGAKDGEGAKDFDELATATVGGEDDAVLAPGDEAEGATLGDEVGSDGGGDGDGVFLGGRWKGEYRVPSTEYRVTFNSW
jgi:hypothetical protein